MNVTSTLKARVEPGGDGVVAHVGLHALGQFADALGLGAALSARIVPAGERFPLHDRGKVLVHAMLTLAGGGDACSDVEFLRAQPVLFGPVPSDSTLYRTYRQIDATTLAGLWEAMGEVRADVWSAVDPGEQVVLDIDATLVDIHSENKEGTASNYKRGFGYHPMFCFADLTGETLAGVLRPGNATANDSADHLGVLDHALGQLPAEIAAGHRPGDDPTSVSRPVMAAPIRRARRPGSWEAVGPATSGSRSWPAKTPRFMRRSRKSKLTTTAGHPPKPRAATDGPVPRSAKSPTSLTCQDGLTAPD